MPRVTKDKLTSILRAELNSLPSGNVPLEQINEMVIKLWEKSGKDTLICEQILKETGLNSQLKNVKSACDLALTYLEKMQQKHNSTLESINLEAFPAIKEYSDSTKLYQDEFQAQKNKFFKYVGALLIWTVVLRGIWWGFKNFVDDSNSSAEQLGGIIFALFLGPMTASIGDIIWVYNLLFGWDNESAWDLAGCTIMFIVGGFLFAVYPKD